MPQKETKPNGVSQKPSTPSPTSKPFTPNPSFLPPHLIQRAQHDPHSLARHDILHLQRNIGNHATHKLLNQATPPAHKLPTAQQNTIQGKFLFLEPIENGWRNFIRKYAARQDLVELVEGSDKIEVNLMSFKNFDTVVNKQGITGAKITTTGGEELHVAHLSKAENIGKIHQMDTMTIDLMILSEPFMQTGEEPIKTKPRSHTEQLVTLAHEWDLHVAPKLELYKEVRDYQANAANTTVIDLGEGLTIPANEMFETNMLEKLKETLTSDDHQNYPNIIKFHQTIINQISALEKIKHLQEDPSQIQKIIDDLSQSLEEQAAKYDWDTERIAEEF